LTCFDQNSIFYLKFS